MADDGRPGTFREALANLGRKLDKPRPGTVAEAMDRAADRLAAAGAEAPRRSAELLAERAFGLSRLGLIMRKKDEATLEQQSAFEALVARREKGEPVAYILGEKEFFGLPFRVGPEVLIPRPETEHVVEEALRLFPPDASFRFADFGTGSGALAVALAHEFPQSAGLAVDLSGRALALARDNARENGVAGRLEFSCADFTALELAPASLDLVVANPPYVSEAEYAALDPGVRDFEPREALLSPDQGLAHIRGLAPVAARGLKPGGWLLCEIGSGQGGAVLEFFREPALGFAEAAILKDLAGLDRVLRARRMA